MSRPRLTKAKPPQILMKMAKRASSTGQIWCRARIENSLSQCQPEIYSLRTENEGEIWARSKAAQRSAAVVEYVFSLNQDRGRGAGFIPQEREHRTDAPAKIPKPPS